MFWSKNKKKVYPCKHQFYYIKVGCKGGFVTRTCFRDEKAVLLLWFFVPCFWCQSFGDVSLMCVHIIFSSVWVAEWPPFGKDLLTRLTIRYLCILRICNLVISCLVLRTGFGF